MRLSWCSFARSDPPPEQRGKQWHPHWLCESGQWNIQRGLSAHTPELSSRSLTGPAKGSLELWDGKFFGFFSRKAPLLDRRVVSATGKNASVRLDHRQKKLCNRQRAATTAATFNFFLCASDAFFRLFPGRGEYTGHIFCASSVCLVHMFFFWSPKIFCMFCTYT